tara:strand:- start:215 stop:337 length:123 start_codon:yes stop_codon:yes gene_type:complete
MSKWQEILKKLKGKQKKLDKDKDGDIDGDDFKQMREEKDE